MTVVINKRAMGKAYKSESLGWHLLKVRNGHWRVMKGTKVISMHSMKEGAQNNLTAILAKLNGSDKPQTKLATN